MLWRVRPSAKVSTGGGGVPAIHFGASGATWAMAAKFAVSRNAQGNHRVNRFKLRFTTNLPLLFDETFRTSIRL
jgi:hypothetical protein